MNKLIPTSRERELFKADLQRIGINPNLLEDCIRVFAGQFFRSAVQLKQTADELAQKAPGLCTESNSWLWENAIDRGLTNIELLRLKLDAELRENEPKQQFTKE